MFTAKIESVKDFFKYLQELEGPALSLPADRKDWWVKVTFDPLIQTTLQAVREAVDLEWFQKGYRVVEIYDGPGLLGPPGIWLRRG